MDNRSPIRRRVALAITAAIILAAGGFAGVQMIENAVHERIFREK